MKKFTFCFICLSLVAVSGCAQNSGSGSIFGSRSASSAGQGARQEIANMEKQYNYSSLSQLMTNENVIVYPVDGPIDENRKAFPENGNSFGDKGGYNVFDPSVQVFSVDGDGGRPSYMPDYSVPQNTDVRRPMLTQKDDVGSSTVTITKSETFLRPDEVRQTPLAPTAQTAPISSQAGRRSRPVLTSYE